MVRRKADKPARRPPRKNLCPQCRLPYADLEIRDGELHYVHGPILVDGKAVYSVCRITDRTTMRGVSFADDLSDLPDKSDTGGPDHR